MRSGSRGVEAPRAQRARRSARGSGGSFGLPSVQSRSLAPRDAVNVGDRVDVFLDGAPRAATVGKRVLHDSTTIYRLDFDDRPPVRYKAKQLQKLIRRVGDKQVSGRRLQLELNECLDMTTAADARRLAREEAANRPSPSRLRTPAPNEPARRKRVQLGSLSNDPNAPRPRHAPRTLLDASVATAARRQSSSVAIERLQSRISELEVDKRTLTLEVEALRKERDDQQFALDQPHLRHFLGPSVDRSTLYMSWGWRTSGGTPKLCEGFLHPDKNKEEETCAALRLFGSFIHDAVVRRDALKVEAPVYDVAGAFERAIDSPTASRHLLWSLVTGRTDAPKEFIEAGVDLDEAYMNRLILGSWVASEVMLKATNSWRSHALPSFLSSVLDNNSARRSMMNLFVLLGFARANHHEIRDERGRVELKGCPTFKFEPWEMAVLAYDNFGYTRAGPPGELGRYSHWVNMVWIRFAWRRLLEIGALDASTKRRTFEQAFPTKEKFVRGVVPCDGFDASTSESACRSEMGSKKTSSSAKAAQRAVPAAAAWPRPTSHLQQGPAPRYSFVQLLKRKRAPPSSGHASSPRVAPATQRRPASVSAKKASTTKKTSSKARPQVASAGSARRRIQW